MFKGVEAFSGLDVPDADRLVIAPRRQVLVVRTPVQAVHPVAAVATCQLHCNGNRRPVRGRPGDPIQGTGFRLFCYTP